MLLLVKQYVEPLILGHFSCNDTLSNAICANDLMHGEGVVLYQSLLKYQKDCYNKYNKGNQQHVLLDHNSVVCNIL